MTGAAATIGGGNGNQATNNDVVIAGCFFNIGSGFRSTISGGETNLASADYATVGGGFRDTASGNGATVGGGRGNGCGGSGSTRPVGGLACSDAWSNPSDAGRLVHGPSDHRALV